MNILVTGGAGFIGSHTVMRLLEEQHFVVVLDDFSTGTNYAIEFMLRLHGSRLMVVRGDIRDKLIYNSISRISKIDAVIHFAGSKSPSESVSNPTKYFSNNISGSITLFEWMQSANVTKLIFSSSASIYGDSHSSPIPETAGFGRPLSPYAYTKQVVEQSLADICNSFSSFSVAVLRYFNPVGAHASGEIGEFLRGTPTNLFPYVCDVAMDKAPHLPVYGSDYKTRDGSGIRDYIHIMDLAEGHVAALSHVAENAGMHVWNLGSGVGYSVLEIIEAFERVCGVKIPYQFLGRRQGDIAISCADISKVNKQMGWRPKFSLEQMAYDTWQWRKKLDNLPCL